MTPRHFASDSVEGQRWRWSEVTRFDLLKVVGSSPARLARPDGEVPARLASASIAPQICAWVSMEVAGGEDIAKPVARGRRMRIRNYNLIMTIRLRDRQRASFAHVVIGEQGLPRRDKAGQFCAVRFLNKGGSADSLR